MSYREISYNDYYNGHQMKVQKFINDNHKRRTIYSFNELGEFNYFNDIGELLYVVENLDRNMLIENTRQKSAWGYDGLSSEKSGSDWADSSSLEEGIERMVRPDKFYAREIKEIQDATEFYLAKDQIRDRPFGANYSVTGLFVDVGKFVAGEPECFIEMDDIEMKAKPFVELYIGHKDCHSTVSPNQIKLYAMRMSILYNTLIAMGCNVALTYCEFSDISTTYVELSDGTSRVPIQTIYSILHPSFFRRLVFRLIERSRIFEDGYGYGRSTSDIELIGVYEAENNASHREFVDRFLTKHNLYQEVQK